MKTLTPIIWLAACLLGVGCNQSSADIPISKQLPNVVIILTDDQGWGDLSHSGNSNLSTPHIDRLAEEGVSFDRFYVQPVCSPTRAELLTGRYHLRSGVYGTSSGEERLDLDEVTLADVFKAAGYTTAAFGKWHSGMQYPYHPNGRGFDEFYGFCSGHWGDYFSPMLEHNGALVRGNGFLVDDLTDKAMGFIEKNQDTPFLLYLPLNTPHSPMQVPDRWWDKFQYIDLEMTLPLEQKEDLAFTKAALAMCENIDWNVGRLMEKIAELNLEENTLVIYFSDNGPNSLRWNGGMKGRKGSTDEGGVRSPFFMRWKGTLTAGRVVSEIAGAIDLLPTLVDLAGIPLSATKPLDGRSLLPLLQQEPDAWEDRIIFHHWNGQTSLRTQAFRLDKDENLFHMGSDPSQTSPVNEQFPEVLQQLLAAKETWEEEMEREKDGSLRPFTLAHPDARFTQLPARDGIAHGNIQRSNRFPNDTYFTNWVSVLDSITWDVEVLGEGEYQVEAYYTCGEANIGSKVLMKIGASTLEFQMEQPHDPPIRGMENDRVERMESYVKDFKPMHLGTIQLKQGRTFVTLKALDIPGSQVMDLRLLSFTKSE
ncbi:MAG: arylsulfatase [Lunatimonas sp.]|uniref:arylsulfatase n=1 Tax=Lunatimonas sp. TaxID=2060141 RepID=UPI00263BB79C|nr:arylsulfatase [Lunatimonas sp.]MCC5937107.1 arylsulfatase [Lunatimonas sp.]